MAQEFYAIEDLSSLLKLHPITIRRFIREGKLPGRKIGRRWMVSHDDLRAFTHTELAGASTPESRTVLDASEAGITSVSAVVELRENADAASRIANSIMAMLNCKDPAWGPARFDFSYTEASRSARFALYGSIEFIQAMLVTFQHTSESRQS